MTPNSPYTAARSPTYALLGFLALGPAHGYDLHQRLTSELGQVWHTSQSQTYAILARLEAQGLIEGAAVHRSRLPARRQLELTPAGRAQFEAWLTTPTGASIRAIRVDFITRLYFAAHLRPALLRGMAAEMLDRAQADQHALQIRLAATADEQRFNRLALELRIRQLAAVIDWLTNCIDREGDFRAPARLLDMV